LEARRQKHPQTSPSMNAAMRSKRRRRKKKTKTKKGM